MVVLEQNMHLVHGQLLVSTLLVQMTVGCRLFKNVPLSVQCLILFEAASMVYWT